MHSNSMTVTAANVARDIEQNYRGSIGKDDLLLVLREHGVNQQGILYIDKMLTWGYLYYDHIADRYCLTDESKQTATIRITVPRLNAKEIRRDIVGRYVGYAGVIEVGEAEI